jgi:hypothetical protein
LDHADPSRRDWTCYENGKADKTVTLLLKRVRS